MATKERPSHMVSSRRGPVPPTCYVGQGLDAFALLVQQVVEIDIDRRDAYDCLVRSCQEQEVFDQLTHPTRFGK